MTDNELFEFFIHSPIPSNNEDLSLAVGQFIEPLPISFEPLSSWSTGNGAESESTVGSSSNYNDFYPSLGTFNVPEPDCQPSDSESANTTILQSLYDSTVWVDDLIRSSSLFAPLASEVIPNLPFDGQIPVEDTKRYTEGVPNGIIFEDDFDTVIYPNKSNHNPFNDSSESEIPSTTVQRQAVLLSNRHVSRSPSITGTSSDPLASDTSSKKRKHEEINNSEDHEFAAVKMESATSRWKPINKSYSMKKVNNRFLYRCALCFEINEEHISRRKGEMERHLQVLKHKRKAFFCHNINSGCSSTFTRLDSLKRHLKCGVCGPVA